jgi:hypothetical protein
MRTGTEQGKARPSLLLLPLLAASGGASSGASGSGHGRPAVNITWAEFTDSKCTQPLGRPAGGVSALGECGVVPHADPNLQWRGSSFQFDRCGGAAAGEPGAVALYSAYSDGGCKKPFVNWTLSLKAMHCKRVPPGPNSSAPRGPPIWHSVVRIGCATLPLPPPPPPAKTDDTPASGDASPGRVCQ